MKDMVNGTTGSRVGEQPVAHDGKNTPLTLPSPSRGEGTKATPATSRLSLPYASGAANSKLRPSSWLRSRSMMAECIWLTRDSERSRVAPISFIVISS